MKRILSIPVPFINHRLIDHFVPPALRGQVSLEEIRARLLIVAVFSVVFFASFFCFSYWRFTGSVLMPGVMMVGMLNIGFAAVVLRKTGSTALACHWVAMTGLFLVVWIAAFTGGITAPVMPWVMIFPLVAQLFASPRAGLMWACLSVVVVVSIYFADTQGVFGQQLLSEGQATQIRVFSITGLLIIVGIFFYLGHSVQDWLFQTLRDRTNELHTIVEMAPNGIITIDDQGKIRDSNRLAAKMFGIDSEALQGRLISEFVPTLRAADESLRPHTEGEQSFPAIDTQDTGLRSDGEEFPLSVSIGYVRRDQDNQIVMVLRDDTELVKMRTQMMRLDRMSAVGTLAMGVGHEINNPLSYIKGNVEYVSRAFSKLEALPENEIDFVDLTDALQDSLHGLNRIESIVADLRMFSRSDVSEMVAVDIVEVLESAIAMAGNQIHHRATVARTFAEVPPVLADASRLNQVFLNLLINAAHAIPVDGGEGHRIEVQVKADGDYVVVSISDTGIGISQEDMTHIFDPFFTTKGPEEGTGLGLAISQKLINEMEGFVTVQSEEAIGTTFSVQLPVAPVDGAGFAEGGPQDEWMKTCDGGRILIVDDITRVCKALERTLGSCFDTDIETDAKQALKRLRNDAGFDVILVDLLMPGMGGLKFYEALETIDPELAQRVIFMSGGSYAPELRTFFEDRDISFIKKPFRPIELFELIETSKNR